MDCKECGISEALARGWYSVSPKTGKPEPWGGWCDACYEKLHTRYIRELYRKRDDYYVGGENVPRDDRGQRGRGRAYLMEDDS